MVIFKIVIIISRYGQICRYLIWDDFFTFDFCIPLRKTEVYIPVHSCILHTYFVALDNFNTNP